MRTSRLRQAIAVALGAAFFAATLAPAAALAAEPVFGQPSVTAVIGQPLSFSSTIDGSDIAAVDVIVHLQGNPTSIVINAGTQINNLYEAQADIDIASSATCACLAHGQSLPNTHFDYQFKVTNSDGQTSFGPVAQAVVEDTRFEWQEYAQDQVVVHWYVGDQAFAQHAASVANEAINNASQLLGVTLDKPADLFVYNTEDDMRSAISPNRENVAGEAYPVLDTMYVNISPSDPGSFPDTVIKHELTHLVFHRAVDNPYNGVPRWLDEGVAVYLSEGYNARWQSYVGAAVTDKSLIPLDGLAGLFPSVQAEFYLAYGEAVASVDFFIRTYGDQTFWNLVKSYSNGVSDDEAFTDATGADVEAFNTAWFTSLGLTPPAPLGPQPAAPGPVPSDWTATGGAPATLSPSTAPGATPAPGTTSAPGATHAPGTTAPRETARPVPSPATGANNGSSTDLTSTVLVLGLVVAIVIATLAVGLAVRSRSSGPPAPPAF